MPSSPLTKLKQQRIRRAKANASKKKAKEVKQAKIAEQIAEKKARKEARKEARKKGKTSIASTPMTPQQEAVARRAAVNDESRREGLVQLGTLFKSHRKERARDNDHRSIEQDMMRSVLQMHETARHQDMESMSLALTPVPSERSNVARPAFLQTPAPSPSPSLLSRFGGYFTLVVFESQLPVLPTPIRARWDLIGLKPHNLATRWHWKWQMAFINMTYLSLSILDDFYVGKISYWICVDRWHLWLLRDYFCSETINDSNKEARMLPHLRTVTTVFFGFLYPTFLYPLQRKQ
jgi:hypothetical protein